MINLEREEVLKKNILTLLAPAERVLPKPEMASTSGMVSAAVAIAPIFRIISDDEDILSRQTQSAAASALSMAHQFHQHYDRRNEASGRNLLNPPPSTSTFDPNFLSPEFMYCGRHGSRGRRNSRTSDCFSASNTSHGDESRKSSFVGDNDLFTDFTIRAPPTLSTSLVNDAKPIYELNPNSLLQITSRSNIAQHTLPSSIMTIESSSVPPPPQPPISLETLPHPSPIFHTSSSSNNIVGLAQRLQRKRPQLRQQYSLDHGPGEMREFQFLDSGTVSNGSSDTQRAPTTTSSSTNNHRRLLTRQTTFV